jgi:hypothetical protein
VGFNGGVFIGMDKWFHGANDVQGMSRNILDPASRG